MDCAGLRMPVVVSRAISGPLRTNAVSDGSTAVRRQKALPARRQTIIAAMPIAKFGIRKLEFGIRSVIPDSAVHILRSRFRIPHSRFSIPDSLDSGCQAPREGLSLPP